MKKVAIVLLVSWFNPSLALVLTAYFLIQSAIKNAKARRASRAVVPANVQHVSVPARTQQASDKLEEKIAKMEMLLSASQTDIDFLEPKRSEIVQTIRDIEEKRHWRTANGHYEDADTKVEKQLDRLQTRLYQIDKKLEKARFNYEMAESFLERYN